MRIQWVRKMVIFKSWKNFQYRWTWFYLGSFGVAGNTMDVWLKQRCCTQYNSELYVAIGKKTDIEEGWKTSSVYVWLVEKKFYADKKAKNIPPTTQRK